MTVIVRRAATEDAAKMSRVLIASITTLCAAAHNNDAEALAAWTRNKTVEGIQVMLSNPDITMFVAQRDTHIAGVGAITSDGTIALNYVAPEARFTGVSKTLLAHMEKALAEHGHEVARLEATATARAFYRERGWREDGPQATGRRVNGYPMVKRLRIEV